MERRGRGGFGGRGGGRREGGRGGFGGGFGGGRREGGFDRGGFDRPKPVKIGEEYDVEITDVGAKGDGICKVENFIVFVAGGRKGEKCRIRIKEVANKFAIGEKVGESEGSEEREDSTEESSDTEESSEEEYSSGSDSEGDEE